MRYDQKCAMVVIRSTRFSSQILMKHEFSRQIFEKCVSNFMKIRPVGAELFHASIRTDGQRVIVFFFRNFANLSENIDVLQGRYLLQCR